ncbi:MAG: class I SAM-dependent methyltransferase [Chloroflexi bacterium]|nr:MAG: class I SAM-dependent methyltransferase [Chloroflexota bacterium]
MILTVTFPETADIETSSEDYARRFSGNVGRWFLEIQERATLDMLAALPQAKTILDVGGGHGQLAPALVNAGYNVTILGSDAICKKRVANLVDRGQCKFEVGNILDLPYPDQSFDVVISYRLLPHVTRWQEYLAELSRVARTAVLLDYPEVRSINYISPLLFTVKKNLEGNTRPFTCFKAKELAAEFKKHGFMASKRYPEFFLPMVLHRKLNTVGISSVLERLCRIIGLTGWLGSPVILQVIREGK